MREHNFSAEALKIFIAENYQRLSYDSWASVEKKFFYINIPKAGCTTVKKMLQAHSGLPVPDGVNPIHSRAKGEFVKSICDFNLTEQLYLLNSDEVNRICIVRNPYTRLLSGYWSKVAGPKRYGEFENIIFQGLGIAQPDRRPTFVELLQFILATSNQQLDIHFRSQSSLCYFDRISYNLHGRFETLQSDLVRIFTELGADQSVLARAGGIENPSQKDTTLNSPLLNEMLQTDNHAQLIKFFKNDFSSFNYAKISK